VRYFVAPLQHGEMGMLEQFVNSVIQAYRNGVSLSVIKMSLIDQDMTEDEVDDLLDIVILESREKQS
jgi:hypothetical protein